jgi:hypothetical protein
MCLPVSRLFWVSSLAYPNLLGTKGYVVVVVVVVNWFTMNFPSLRHFRFASAFRDSHMFESRKLSAAILNPTLQC